MKKVLILLAILFISLPVYATQWVEFSYKSYYDEDLWQQNGNYVTVWFKLLNTGDLPLKNNKKVWYSMEKVIADCGNYKVAFLTTAYYGLKDELLDLYDFDTNRYHSYDIWLSSLHWINIMPDTVGEERYNLMCSLRD